MGRLIVDAATSLDGFWADTCGRSVVPGEHVRDTRMAERFADGCGAVVMSCRSLASAPDHGYTAGAPVFVVGEDMATAGAGRTHVQFIETYAAAFGAARAAAGDKPVLVLGEASALRAAMGSGEADDVWLRVISQTLGAGSPLFDDAIPVADYFVSEMRTTPGAVHMHLERR